MVNSSCRNKRIYKEGGNEHIKTATNNPQLNEQAERFVDTLKRDIKNLKEEERPTQETLDVMLQA